MENSRFGVYNKVKDEPIYQYKYTDNQYTRNARLGAMLNLAFTGSKSRFYFRNIFNQLGSNRYTERRGWRISALYIFGKSRIYLWQPQYLLWAIFGSPRFAGRDTGLESGLFVCK